MTDELLPCPFCGSKEENPYDHTPECYLRQLWSLIEDVSEPSREDVLKAWNTRAERTCGLRSRLTGMYCYECSKCGRGMKADWAYCPHCGAKVVQ